MEAALGDSGDLFDRETILPLAGDLEVVLSLAVSSPAFTRFHEAIEAERARGRSAEQHDMDSEMKTRLETGRRRAVRI